MPDTTPRRIRTWWATLPPVRQAAYVVALSVATGFGVGLRADEVFGIPRRVHELETTLRMHLDLPAHPGELRARMQGDSAIVDLVNRVSIESAQRDSLIVARLECLLTVQLRRLDGQPLPPDIHLLCPAAPIGGQP